MLQQVIATAPQSRMFDSPPPGLEFPLSLAERYQPRTPEEFIDLDRPKKLLATLAAKPRAAQLLFIGPPGSGKSVMGLAFAEMLPGSLHHVSAQKCDVSTLDLLSEKFAYAPLVGSFWVCLVDEADQMTEKAQLQLLSRMDGTASLRPTFGGGYVRGTPPPVIWIFTANGRGEDHTEPPAGFAPRFLSRCMIVPFPAASPSSIAAHLAEIWRREGGGPTPEGYFEYMAAGTGVRDALMRLETDLLCGCRAAPIARARTITLVPKSRSEAALKAWVTRRANSS